VLFYSSTLRRLREGRRRNARHILNGLAFGALGVGLAIARIQVAPDVYFDARNVPVALIALFEGWTAGLLAAGVVALYRWWWLSGIGTVPGVVSVLAVAVVGGLVHWWATRHGRVGTGHAFALGIATFLATLLGYALLGRPGLEKFAATWPHFLIAYVGGIGILAQLFRDVVEREQLSAAQQRFRALLDEASDAIRIVDPASHRIIETNRADSTLSGSPRASLIGRDARDFWPEDPDSRARWEALTTEAAKAGMATGFGLPYRAPGGVRTVDLTVRRVVHDARAYEIVMIRDAAAREALDAARREVLDLRAITLVANAAAHEINNPLTVIVGSVELLQRRLPIDGPETRWVDRAIESAQRIREIIARMTRITRVEPSGTFPSVPAMLDIRRSSDDN
jgi:PAS domain S-box-containing protein